MNKLFERIFNGYINSCDELGMPNFLLFTVIVISYVTIILLIIEYTKGLGFILFPIITIIYLYNKGK